MVARKAKQESTPEANSKYQPTMGSVDLHKSMIKLFDQTLIGDNKYFGCMMMVRDNGVNYYIINKHQLKKTVEILNSNGQYVRIPSPDTWVCWKENGKDSIYRLPVQGFPIQIAGARPVGIGKLATEEANLLFVGRNGRQEDFVTATNGTLKGGYIVHSAWTETNVCGSFLYDSQRQVAVGMHCRTDGPNPSGDNNFCASFF